MYLFLVETEHEELPHTKQNIGLDLGIKDYLHKISYEMLSKNQVIVSGKLQIKNMVKNHHLEKSIADAS